MFFSLSCLSFLFLELRLDLLFYCVFPYLLLCSEGKFTMSREIEPVRMSFRRRGSCTLAEVARLVPSGPLGRCLLAVLLLISITIIIIISMITMVIIGSLLGGAVHVVARLVLSGPSRFRIRQVSEVGRLRKPL